MRVEDLPPHRLEAPPVPGPGPGPAVRCDRVQEVIGLVGALMLAESHKIRRYAFHPSAVMQFSSRQAISSFLLPARALATALAPQSSILLLCRSKSTRAHSGVSQQGRQGLAARPPEMRLSCRSSVLNLRCRFKASANFAATLSPMPHDERLTSARRRVHLASVAAPYTRLSPTS